MPSIFSLRTRNSIIRRLPMGRRVCRWRARAACLRGGLWELHLCVATNELGNSNASIILYALLLRLSACDRPERGQGKSRQDCWDAFHLLPAYQKLHQPTVTRGPKGVQMEGKGRLSQRRATGTAPVCGHERAGQQQCQHHPVCRANSARCQTERVLSSEDPSEDDEETCTGPRRRALHGSGWWWSPWVFRDEQQTVKRQRTSLERRPKERPRASLVAALVCMWLSRARPGEIQARLLGCLPSSPCVPGSPLSNGYPWAEGCADGGQGPPVSEEGYGNCTCVWPRTSWATAMPASSCMESQPSNLPNGMSSER
ncbi:uncharacterized protein AAGF69_008523 isoform 3-T3 [Amazona ochrocephala]